MQDGFFFSDVDKNSVNSKFITDVQCFSEENLKQMYVLNKPLGEKKYNYDYKDAVVLLVPKYKILFINFGKSGDEFEEYCEDFKEDLGFISDKYDYKQILGRPRQWKYEYFNEIQYDEYKDIDIPSLLELNKLDTKEKERNSEFIISLLTGSINDVSRVGIGYPDNLLEKIRRKIILFDADQTRFIYKEIRKKRITIQGLAGTGKTELLLHKLKELYTKDKETKIVFTCHNKILAQSLKKRIPEFFNFMKVDEQIKWNERLWAVNGWGSQANQDSGVYSFICNYYKIPFQSYSYINTFDKVCGNALKNLEEIEHFEPCFDYILIDESQDFPESFFKLCEKVTRVGIYVAGDIFQNVFDDNIVSKVIPDFLLNKCYRTDPKTLMFAHAVGMGLFEETLRWLEDKEWEACGYLIDKENGMYHLSRKPLRRFEDLDEYNVDSIQLIPTDTNQYTDQVISILEEIVDENPTVKPDDIGIIFLENINKNYQLADYLKVRIQHRFKWDVNMGYETKSKSENSLFISNRNNVKGLEFPFVICIAQNDLSNNLRLRNSLYMMLTRSFLTTYFILPNNDIQCIQKLKQGIEGINHEGILSVKEPSPDEKDRLRNAIIDQVKLRQSPYDVIENIMNECSVPVQSRSTLRNIISILLPNGEFDEDKIREIIEKNVSLT